MKPTILLLLAATLLPVSAAPEELSSLDAQLLLERLEVLRSGSKERAMGRYTTAYSAFQSAIQSDDAAHELYLMCVEKVQFEDEKRKSQDFRDWKRRHKERVDSPEFRRALRHQLNWLLLTLKAASDPEKTTELGEDAMARIDAIFEDADKLTGEESRLRQDVLQSVFATAYGLGGIEMEDWPMAPLQLATVYNKLILPPLRKPSKVAGLRAAWTKRILHEGSVHAEWARPSSGRGGREERPVDLERFLADRRPQLLWEMEVDLFKAGDQKGAALRMLAHIEKYVGHKNSGKWIEEFQEAVKGTSKKLDVDPDEPEKIPKGKESEAKSAKAEDAGAQ